MATSLVVPSSAPLTIVEKLNLVEAELTGRLMERRQHAETAVLALVSKSHFCQYGDPGTGKTLIIDLLIQCIEDVISYRWLMTRFTTPEELFGPISLKGLENDEFRRNLTGKMVGSNITFLDEIFKSNSAVLNALLTIANEGLFFNGADTIESRPIIFCGSNELPKDAELAALWDRITFRMEVTRIRENGNVRQMLQAKARSLFLSEPIVPIISWAEIEQAQQEATKVEIPDIVYDTLIQLKNSLRKKGIEPTDRRFTDTIGVIKAQAYRNGRTVADVDDISPVRHMLWLETSQIPIVERLVLELANPLDKEAIDLISVVDQLAEEVDQIRAASDNAHTRRVKGVQINNKLTRVDEDLNKLLSKVAASPKRSEMVEEARNRVSSVVAELLDLLWNADGEA